MDDIFDKEMQDFEEQIEDDLGYMRKQETNRKRRKFSDFKPQKKTLIFGGAGIIIVIILIALFSGNGGDISNKDLSAIQVRLDLLEKRLTRLEGVEVKIARLERQTKGLQQSMAERERSGRYLSQELDKLNQRVGSLQKGKAVSGISTTKHRKPPSLTKKRFHEVSPGETLYRIAKKYGISVTELCRLNNITPEQVITPGQKLLVTPGKPQ